MYVTDLPPSAGMIFCGTGGSHICGEIFDFHDTWYDYLELLYDRIPTLPQSLRKDFGFIGHLWQNIARRVARTRV